MHRQESRGSERVTVSRKVRHRNRSGSQRNGYFSALTGLVERPDLKKLLDRKKRHSLAEQGEYAYMATLEAFRQARIEEKFLLENEVGILYGNDSSAAPVIQAIDIIREKKNTALVGSGSIFQSMNSTITMNLSVIFHLKGINFTISGACASGSHAIGMAYLLIKSGLQDCHSVRRSTGSKPLFRG